VIGHLNLPRMLLRDPRIQVQRLTSGEVPITLEVQVTLQELKGGPEKKGSRERRDKKGSRERRDEAAGEVEVVDMMFAAMITLQ
jgi:hypothetical protein